MGIFWKHENVFKLLYTNRTETRVEDLLHMIQRLHMTTILTVASTRNAVHVIKESLLDGTSFFITEKRIWDRIFPQYHHISNLYDIRNVDHTNHLQHSRERRLSIGLMDPYFKVISVCTLDSVYHVFYNTDHGYKHRNVQPFYTNIIDGKSHAAGSDLFILYDHINLFLPHQNLSKWPWIVHIAAPLQLRSDTFGTFSMCTATK